MEERAKMKPLPRPDEIDSRICLSIAFYKDEDTANTASEIVWANRDTYWGGMFHGMPCGRETARDFERDGVKYHAVTYYFSPHEL